MTESKVKNILTQFPGACRTSATDDIIAKLEMIDKLESQILQLNLTLVAVQWTV
jgi:hypothetical protein